MQHSKVKYLILTLLIGLFLPLKAFALDVQSVRFGLHESKTRLVLDLSQTADFRAFMLDDPYRMVVDLPSFDWKAGDVRGPEAAGVNATRHGNLKPGISRIVFDMNRAVSIQKAFVLPANNATPPRLVIDFANVPPSMFAQTKNKIHGNLEVNSAKIGTVKTSQNVSNTQNNTPPPPRKTKKPLIVIDPGHGGVDPGAVGHHGLKERDIVLKLSQNLKMKLEASGQYRVKMTREGDRFIKLSNRVKFARDHGADLFVSLHADALDNKNVRGASIYTLSEKASDAQSAKLAARENKADLIAGIDLSTEDEDVANILMDLAKRETMNQSKFFANTLVSSFKGNGLKTLPRPHRYAGFAVLKAPDIPSVLIEAGFMSNDTEADLLNTSAHRTKIANAIKAGIDTYFEQVRKNQRM